MKLTDRQQEIITMFTWTAACALFLYILTFLFLELMRKPPAPDLPLPSPTPPIVEEQIPAAEVSESGVPNLPNTGYHY